MSENVPTNVQLDTNKNGSVTFATDVVATIAGLAATEVEGVASMYSGSMGLAGILGGRDKNAKNLTKGVKVEVTGSNVSVAVSINVEFGYAIPDVARNIQENVKKAVETMSGLTVDLVDVNVVGLSFEKENRDSAQISSGKRVLLQQKKVGKGETAPQGGVNAPKEEEEPEEDDPEEEPFEELPDEETQCDAPDGAEEETVEEL